MDAVELLHRLGSDHWARPSDVTFGATARWAPDAPSLPRCWRSARMRYRCSRGLAARAVDSLKAAMPTRPVAAGWEIPPVGQAAPAFTRATIACAGASSHARVPKAHDIDDLGATDEPVDEGDGAGG